MQSVDQTGIINDQQMFAQKSNNELIIDILKKHGVSKVNVTDEKLDLYFKAADLNGDGKISLEEAEIFFRDHLLQ